MNTAHFESHNPSIWRRLISYGSLINIGLIATVFSGYSSFPALCTKGGEPRTYLVCYSFLVLIKELVMKKMAKVEREGGLGTFGLRGGQGYGALGSSLSKKRGGVLSWTDWA
jgi:hypothetical protein